MMKYIYVLVDDLGRVKIGMTDDFPRELESFRNSSGRRIVDFYCSTKQESVLEIERQMYNQFSKHLTFGGGWIDGIDFDMVREVLALFEVNADAYDFKDGI